MEAAPLLSNAAPPAFFFFFRCYATPPPRSRSALLSNAAPSLPRSLLSDAAARRCLATAAPLRALGGRGFAG